MADVGDAFEEQAVAGGDPVVFEERLDPGAAAELAAGFAGGAVGADVGMDGLVEAVEVEGDLWGR